MGTETVAQRIANLRERRKQLPDAPQRAVVAMRRMAALWQTRLDNEWMPPPGSAFPWSMVRRSLCVLLPGFVNVMESGTGNRGSVLALILAGNTPLLAWPALTAALAAGVPILVKLSRDESLWTILFVEALAEIDSEVAGLVDMDVWRGDDTHTVELVQEADAVVAYGSDTTIASLRQITPDGKPFYGFGHALSIGISTAVDGNGVERFASDILLYNQGGCLSPHAILVQGGAAEVMCATLHLTDALLEEVESLDIPPVSDSQVARAVRQARDMALFDPEIIVDGDADLRWTVLINTTAVPIALPVGHGVVQLIPFHEETLAEQLGTIHGYLSSVGVDGELTPVVENLLRSSGVSRICAAGSMQTPPLDWLNDNVNLFEKMRRLAE